MDDPWPEMFDANAMDTLVRLLNIKSLSSARADFIAVGHRIRAIIDTTPTDFDRGPDDIPLSRRARWLERRVLKPSKILRVALIEDPKFAEYPESHVNSITAEERRCIAQHLEKLEAFANDLHNDLDYRSKRKNLRHKVVPRHVV